MEARKLGNRNAYVDIDSEGDAEVIEMQNHGYTAYGGARRGSTVEE